LFVLRFSDRAEEFYLCHDLLLHSGNAVVTKIEICPHAVKGGIALNHFCVSLHANAANVGEYIYLAYAVRDSVAEIVVGKSASTVKNEWNVNGVAYIGKTLKIELGRTLVCAVSCSDRYCKRINARSLLVCYCLGYLSVKVGCGVIAVSRLTNVADLTLNGRAE
jgi:hypothetical protein